MEQEKCYQNAGSWWLSGHHNWKANQPLFGLEKQPYWFCGGAFETPLSICCRKDVKLGVRERFFFFKSKIGRKKQKKIPISCTKSALFPEEQELFL